MQLSEVAYSAGDEILACNTRGDSMLIVLEAILGFQLLMYSTQLHRVDRSPLFRRSLRPLGPGLFGAYYIKFWVRKVSLGGVPIKPLAVPQHIENLFLAAVRHSYT